MKALLFVIFLFGLGLRSSAQASNLSLTPNRSNLSVGLGKPRFAQGSAIPQFLGNRLQAVAAEHQLTVQALQELCLRDRHLYADALGALHHICPAPPPLLLARSQQAADEASAQQPPTFTLTREEVFDLNSKPRCNKVIFLDFDGHTTTATSWNTAYADGGAITTPPYSTDSAVSVSFSSAELSNIYDIWKRVSEDFKPFDVTVTTRDPGVDGLRKVSEVDGSYGIRVCIGGTFKDWLGRSAGGVAYLRSFNFSTDTPVFVFSGTLNGSVKSVAEAVSHEVGHSMGLSHDGTTSGSEYYDQNRDRPGIWAPIMGVGYYKEIVQWSKGEYPGANNTEDDLDIISKMVGYRQDNAVDDTLGNAVVLSTAGGTFTTESVIEKSSDADIYVFTASEGDASFSVSPDSLAPNLNLSLSLLNAQGVRVATDSPTDSMSATISQYLESGTYYLVVQSSGQSGGWGSGYGSYGSIGYYRLDGTVVAVSGARPVAAIDVTPFQAGDAPVSVSFSGSGSSDSDGSIASYRWDFGDGSVSTEATPTHAYDQNGLYRCSLVVTDDTGLSSIPAQVLVSIGREKTSAISDARIGIYAQSKTSYQLVVWLGVSDQDSLPLSNARVIGQWSGGVSGTVSGFTTARGRIGFLTPPISIRSRSAVTFTVNNIGLYGYRYEAVRNSKSAVTFTTR